MSTRLYLRLTPAERARLCEVLRWARANGCHRSRSHREHNPESLAWFQRHDSGGGAVAMIDRYTLTTYRFGAPFDRVQLTLERPLSQVLSVLAALGFLPARFADLGLDALRDHAQQCARQAEEMLGQRHDPLAVMRILYAAGLYRAAQAAQTPTVVAS